MKSGKGMEIYELEKTIAKESKPKRKTRRFQTHHGKAQYESEKSKVYKK